MGTVLLPYAPASVAVARQRLAADLIAAGIFAGAVGDAVLVVSELLSNAIRHARPLPGASVQVAWALDDDAVEVAVSDGGALTRPTPAQPTGVLARWPRSRHRRVPGQDLGRAVR